MRRRVVAAQGLFLTLLYINLHAPRRMENEGPADHWSQAQLCYEMRMYEVVSYVIMKLCASYLWMVKWCLPLADARGLNWLAVSDSVIGAMVYERSIVWIAFSAITLDWKVLVLRQLKRWRRERMGGVDMTNQLSVIWSGQSITSNSISVILI